MQKKLTLGFCLLLFSPILSYAGASCPEGSILTDFRSEELGSFCFPDYLLPVLDDSLNSYITLLQEGRDISELKTYIEQDSSYYTTENPNPEDTSFEYWKHFYDILSKRFESKSQELCKQNTSLPEIIVGNEGIYKNNTLTPSCQVKTPSTGSGFASISLSFQDELGENVIYSHTGTSFSGITVDVRGTGKHIVSCSYRPNSCSTASISQKDIIVQSPVQREVQKYSIARQWNEVVLDAIRKDRVRPPVQARNLFHFSAALYDIWALYHPENKPYLFGKSQITECQIPLKVEGKKSELALNKSLSFAAYHIILARYHESPGYTDTVAEANALMNRLGYDISEATSSGTISQSALIGNTVASCYLAYGKTDGANEDGITEVLEEVGSYANSHYIPYNPGLNPHEAGNPNILDWNRWQPLSLSTFIDQAGNPIPGGAATFIGAEWGNVSPFSLQKSQQTIHERDGQSYITYMDPGIFPQATGSTLKLYQWNFALVGLWSSHLGTQDGVMIDISPAKMGNTKKLPTSFSGMLSYYDMKNGGVSSLGRSLNPLTKKPYAPNIVPRGDYTRAIAEFWADGPNSETPPGHWFSILNSVGDKLSEKRFAGTGVILSPLEWDIKSYFTLGGALHDAAIAAWGIKGAYDGVRPVSAIRAMASAGQSSDPKLPHYDIMGLPLISGYTELVQAGDPLEGRAGKNIGKIKMKAWKGPKYINDTETDAAGVDWILAENWWPYQRPSFVTPPFAGYVSGHSTFSRTAAEVLTKITGSSYFPGGLFEVPLKARNYLVFEQGPSKDITLQWATYQDAANESALSRIWGGIHPPMDDIPGRIIGEKIGKQAFAYASYFFKK